MTAPDLKQRANQARALALLLEVNCPDPQHAYARAGVACYAPSERFPRGWVCLPRIEKEIDSRAFRMELRRREAGKRARDERERQLSARRADATALIIEQIAAAARAARAKES